MTRSRAVPPHRRRPATLSKRRGGGRLGRISFLDRAWAGIAAGPGTAGDPRPQLPGAGYFLAHLWRESRTFEEALRHWMAENPEVPGVLDQWNRRDLAEVSLLTRLATETLPPPSLREALAERLGPEWYSMLPERDEATAFVERIANEVAAGRTLEEMRALLPDDSPFRPVFEAIALTAEASANDMVLREVAEKTQFAGAHSLRGEIGNALLGALGGSEAPDYEAAKETLSDYRDRFGALRALSPSELIIKIEVDRIIAPLLLAFDSPRAFFSQVLPVLAPEEVSGEDLAGCLYRWGPGTLLNPTVYAAFNGCTAEPVLAGILAAPKPIGGFGGSGGRPSPGKRDYRSLAVVYYRLRRGTKKGWLEDEAAKPPAIDPESLRALIRRHRPR